MVNSIEKFGLPIDESKDESQRQVKGYNYSRVTPTPLENVRIVSLSKDCLKWIGMQGFEQKAGEKDFAEVLAGNTLFPGSKPLSHCYCGH